MILRPCVIGIFRRLNINLRRVSCCVVSRVAPMCTSGSCLTWLRRWARSTTKQQGMSSRTRAAWTGCCQGWASRRYSSVACPHALFRFAGSRKSQCRLTGKVSGYGIVCAHFETYVEHTLETSWLVSVSGHTQQMQARLHAYVHRPIRVPRWWMRWQASWRRPGRGAWRRLGTEACRGTPPPASQAASAPG